MPEWRDYQERTARFFRELGLEAETDATIQGVRTAHDVDVVVRTNHVGFPLLWLVECKNWKRQVSKLHVLALREIVSDAGADRGILMAEEGYQSGAFEAAQLTNVHLTSLAELTDTAGYEIGMAQLKTIQARLDECRDRYWDLDKALRIDSGLRPDVGFPGYSGAQVIKRVEIVLYSAFRGSLPFVYSELMPLWGNEPIPLEFAKRDGYKLIRTPNDLFALIEPMIDDLEKRLNVAEQRQRSDG